MSKMGSHDPFGHFYHKLWPKEKSGVISDRGKSCEYCEFVFVRGSFVRQSAPTVQVHVSK